MIHVQIDYPFDEMPPVGSYVSLIRTSGIFEIKHVKELNTYRGILLVASLEGVTNPFNTTNARLVNICAYNNLYDLPL